jgi:hypothetical protein
VYEVHCLTVPHVSGVYTCQDGKGRYLQMGGLHILTRHSSGFWGVGDAKNYIVLADKTSALPTDVTSWKVLVGTSYRPDPGTYIRLQRTTPPSSPSAPAAAVSAASTSPTPPASATKLPAEPAGGKASSLAGTGLFCLFHLSFDLTAPLLQVCARMWYTAPRLRR